jgi:hypothetical protein
MILTRAPSRAPFTLAVKITPGPQPALVRQSALRPLRFALTIVRRGDSLAAENSCRRDTPTARPREALLTGNVAILAAL